MGDISSLSPAMQAKCLKLEAEGKALAKTGHLVESLKVFEEVYDILPTQKTLGRINKLKNLLEKLEAEEEADCMVEIVDGFSLFVDVYNKLYDYQRTGVAWMYKLFTMRKGGILGDDMGLGKTFQIIAFLSGMIDNSLVKHVLIVMPVSLLPNWEKEFEKWCPGISVLDFHSSTKKKREQNLRLVQRRGGILLTSYGMVVSNYDTIANYDNLLFIWDYVILDEGHKIKNPTKTTKAVHEIASKHRLVLTGTPIQNNLQELWALYDYAHQGTLLGSLRTFKMQYEAPINRGREKDSTVMEKKMGMEIASNLRKVIEPFFLRRAKLDVLTQAEEGDDVGNLSEQLGSMKMSSLPQKNEFVVWLYLSDAQYEIYTSFLQSDAVKQVLLETKRSPLVALTTLKKICDHPRLLSQRACHNLGLNPEPEGENEENMLSQMEDESYGASSIENVPDSTLLNESGKLSFAIALIENLIETGHRTLVFSLSRKILDMIQRILFDKGIKVLRIDGTIKKMTDRHAIIDRFQRDSSFAVFLLTTQVGGVGLTLTKADRVIIYDPSWNPATDAQAVDRAYRIGQKSRVVVYRLITCGSVEEKIYRRQIFKDSIMRQATGGKDPHRYFTVHELRELFEVGERFSSKTQQQLAAMHASERKTDTELDDHIAFLHSLDIFGISDHDLMFSIEGKVDEHAEIDEKYIKSRVAAAQELVQKESIVLEEGLKQSGSYYKAFDLPIPSSKKAHVPDKYESPKFLGIEKSPSDEEQASVVEISDDSDSTNDSAGKQDIGFQHQTIEPNVIDISQSPLRLQDTPPSPLTPAEIADIMPIHYVSPLKLYGSISEADSRSPPKAEGRQSTIIEELQKADLENWSFGEGTSVIRKSGRPSCVIKQNLLLSESEDGEKSDQECVLVSESEEETADSDNESPHGDTTSQSQYLSPLGSSFVFQSDEDIIGDSFVSDSPSFYDVSEALTHVYAHSPSVSVRKDTSTSDCSKGDHVSEMDSICSPDRTKTETSSVATPLKSTKDLTKGLYAQPGGSPRRITPLRVANVTGVVSPAFDKASSASRRLFLIDSPAALDGNRKSAKRCKPLSYSDSESD